MLTTALSACAALCWHLLSFALCALCWHLLFCAIKPIWPNPACRAKVLSTLYGAAVVPIATRRLLINLNGVHDTGSEPAELVWYLFGLAASYYLWALAMTVADGAVLTKPLAAFHHLVCFGCYSSAMCDPVNILPYVSNAGQVFLLSEISTIFANLRWFAYLSIELKNTGSPQPVEPPDAPGEETDRWPVESEKQRNGETPPAVRKAQRLLSLARMFEMLFLASFIFGRLVVGMPTSVIWWLRDAPQLSRPLVAVYTTAGVLWHLMNFFWLGKALICPRGRKPAGLDDGRKDTTNTVKLNMSIGASPCTDELSCEVSVSDALDAKVEIWFGESKDSITRMSANIRFVEEFGRRPQRETEAHSSPRLSTKHDTTYVSHIHGAWYDFTEFKHPGGPVALNLALHRDATALFEAHHPFTSRSKLASVLRKYEIPKGSEREKELERSGLLAQNEPDPYSWDYSGVNGRQEDREAEKRDQFEIELKEMGRQYFVQEAKRRGVSFQQATKATPLRWCQVAALAAAYLVTVPGMLRGEWWTLLVSPFLAWVWLANMYHDACHFSLSTRWWVNAALPYFTPWLSSPLTWYHQHVVGHHAYPNVGRMDPDLAHAPQLLRHHDTIRWRETHRGQDSTSRTMFIWAVGTFGLSVLSDVRMLVQGMYNKVVPMQRIGKTRLFAHAMGRALFFMVTYVWPFLLFVCWREAETERDWRRAVLFAFVPQMIFSLLFMACSQVNHLTPSTTHGSSKNYFRHQVQTAQDFMVHSSLAFWLSGGLNMQIEHHLFPTVCHCHLRKLQPMVASLCKKHGVAYNTADSWLVAYRQHCEHTKEMAQDPDHEHEHEHDPYEGADPTVYVWGGLAALCMGLLVC